MSRSRKKTPIIGFANVASEKEDKQVAHRRERHDVKTQLSQGLEPENHHHPHSGSEMFAKDGKRWVDNPDPKDLRK